MVRTKAYRYAIRDDLGRTILHRDWVPAKVSDVEAERAGNIVTLYDNAQVLEQVEVAPEMGPLRLYRWELTGTGSPEPVTVPVAVVDVD